MQDRRVQLTIVIVAALVLLGGGVGLWAAHRPAPAPIVITPPPSAVGATVSPYPAPSQAVPVPAPAPPPETKYYVHVAGAVRNPSLYLLSPGSRVMQAIKAAGGPTSKADLDAVNLAEKVKDGEKIYVPAKAAVTQTAMVAPPGNSLGHDGTPPPSVTAPSVTEPTKITKSSKGGSKSNKLTSPAQGQIDINTAGTEQLERLPGVGPAMAGRILAYRQQAGGFQKVEELQEISGIGPKKYAKIAPLVKL